MKAYLVVTGAVFGLIVLAHALRFIEEGLASAKNPWFVITSVLSVALCVWAWRLLRVASR